MWLQVCASRMETGESCVASRVSDLWSAGRARRYGQRLDSQTWASTSLSLGFCKENLCKLVLSLKGQCRECSLSHRESQSPNCQPVVMQIESGDPIAERSRYLVTIMLLKSKSHSNAKNYFGKFWDIHLSPK